MIRMLSRITRVYLCKTSQLTRIIINACRKTLDLGYEVKIHTRVGTRVITKHLVKFVMDYSVSDFSMNIRVGNSRPGKD